MDDIRHKRIKEPRKFKYIFYNCINWIWKNKWKILLTSIILTILFFPTFSGSAIGGWLSKLVSNFLQNLIF